MILVLNKIDLVPAHILKAWIDYFHKNFADVTCIPFKSFDSGPETGFDPLKKHKRWKGRRRYDKSDGNERLLELVRKMAHERGITPSVHAVDSEAQKDSVQQTTEALESLKIAEHKDQKQTSEPAGEEEDSDATESMDEEEIEEAKKAKPQNMQKENRKQKRKEKRKGSDSESDGEIERMDSELLAAAAASNSISCFCGFHSHAQSRELRSVASAIRTQANQA